MKIKGKHKKLFEVYSKVQVVKDGPCLIECDPDGMSAVECFMEFDSHGRLSPCREPEKLHRALSGKEQLNLRIKLWADGCIELPMTYRETFDYAQDNFPEWVSVSLKNQIIKRMGYEPGWVSGRTSTLVLSL